MGSPTAGIEVRVAGAGDLASIASLRSQWTGDTEHDPVLERRIGEWLEAEGERRTTWLAIVGELPVGMAGLVEFVRMPRPGKPTSRWGYVSSTFVREEFRGVGIGAALLEALTATADERSYVRLIVSPSEESFSFYRRGGFLDPGAPDGEVLLVRPGPMP